MPCVWLFPLYFGLSLASAESGAYGAVASSPLCLVATSQFSTVMWHTLLPGHTSQERVILSRHGLRIYAIWILQASSYSLSELDIIAALHVWVRLDKACNESSCAPVALKCLNVLFIQALHGASHGASGYAQLTRVFRFPDCRDFTWVSFPCRSMVGALISYLRVFWNSRRFKLVLCFRWSERKTYQ